MSYNQIDTSTSFAGILKNPLPLQREVEVADVNNISPDNIPKETIWRECYIPSDELVEAVDLALALGRPLLLQGEPGCGKTRLAYAVAYALGLPLEECYIKSTTRAQDLLYTYDAVKRLYDAQLKDKDMPLAAPDKYFRLGPLGRAIARAQNGRRSVVLIDEIDKADLDFPNDLLWELDRLEFSIPEVPGLRYKADSNPGVRPLIFVTHNEEKTLPAAFLRRCIYFYVPFPKERTDLENILKVHGIENKELTDKAIAVLLHLRTLDLTKPPGLSEFLDWIGYLEATKATPEELEKIPHLGVLVKQFNDQQRVHDKGKDEVKLQ